MLLASAPKGLPCSACSLPTAFSHEEVCCGRLHLTNARYNKIRDLMAKGLKSTQPIRVQTEAPISAGSQQRADIVVSRTTEGVL
jgi:hypothetical protein